MHLNTKKYLLVTLSLAVIYYFTGQLGLLLQKFPGVTPLWPPSGIALAALLIFGKRVWPGIVLGVLLLAYVIGVPLVTTVFITIGNTLEPLLAVLLLEKTIGRTQLFQRVRNVFTFLGFAVFLAPIFSSTLGAIAFCAGGVQPWSDFNTIWLSWWLGNTMGILVLTPLIIIWQKKPNLQLDRWRLAEAAALLILLVAVGWSIFQIHYTSSNINLPLTYLPLPIVLWVAIRFSFHGASTANFVLAVITVVNGFHSPLLLAGDRISNVLLLEVTFIGVTAATSLTAAAILYEKQFSAEVLRNIVEGTASFTGKDFFNSLVKHLAHTLQINFAFICELPTSAISRARTLSFWAGDRYLENFTYDTRETPCEEVLSGTLRYYPAHVRHLFPEVDFMNTYEIEGYLGAPLTGSSGQVIGHLVIMDNRRLTDEKRLKTMVEIFAARAAAELQREHTEKALRENEARTVAIVNTAAEGIIMVNSEGEVESFNPAAQQIFGYTESEIIGKNFSQLLTPACLNEYQNDLERILESSQDDLSNQRRELTGRRKNGTSFPLHLSISHMRLNGKIHYTGIVQDVTERKHGQKALFQRMKLSEFGEEIGHALMKSTDLRKNLQLCAEAIIKHLDAVLARIWLIDESGKYLHLKASAGLYTHLNGPHSKIPVGKYKIGKIAETRKPQLTNTVISDPHIHDKTWVKEQRLVGFAGYPLLLEGQMMGVLGVFSRHALEDVTLEALSATASGISQTISRKNAEEALRRSEARYRFLVENAPVGILTTDVKGNILDVNPEILKILGSSSKDFTRQYNLLTFPPLVEAGISSDFKTCLETGELVVSERPYVSQSGKKSCLRLNLVPIRDHHNHVSGVQAIVEDILDRKEAEEKIKSSLKEKEILLKEIHHRVKNNLQVISSLLKLQSKRLKDQKTLAILNESHNRIRAMALIHENLYKSNNLAQIDFKEYIDDLMRQLLRSYLQTKQKIVIKTTIERKFLDIDLAVPCGLIITELVSNSLLHAFKHRKTGEIEISLSNGKGKFELVVKDNGSGLPDDIDFVASDTLGLQLVHELTQQISGSLDVSKQRGTEFRIVF